MQTVQELAGALNDHASLQKLRERLQDIPKLWVLPRPGEAEDRVSNLSGIVSGEYNYHFRFHLEGGGFFQTGVLIASAESSPGGMPVPLRCTWKRRVNDLAIEMQGVTSNMYQISADDVGTSICVEAKPADADDGHVGLAFGEIGPFELDPGTRRSLDNALGAGHCKFAAMQSMVPGEPLTEKNRQEVSINVTAESITVVPLQGGTEKAGKEVSAEFSPEYPRVIIHHLDTSKFQLILNEARTFHLHALSRTSRDLIALTIRCFHAKKFLSTSDLLQELFPVHRIAPGSKAGGSDGHLDKCILLERIAKELNRSMQQKEISDRVLRNTHREKEELQKQIMETIGGYTEVIEGLQQQCAEGMAAARTPTIPIERLQEEYREAQSCNQAMQAEIQAMRRHLEEARRTWQAAEAVAPKGDLGGLGTAVGQEVSQLQEERNLLQARLQELSTNSVSVIQREQADQGHAQELKRLRQDVEMLHDQKVSLRRTLQDADRTRQELQENFLYVKGQLDKVQMKQAQSSQGSGADDKEIARCRQNLEAVTEERNRLSVRMEALCRELEKDKAYHEASLERVMAANGRLMEEKDRSDKEVKRLSRLYAEAVQQVQQQSQTLQSGVFRNDSVGGSPSDEFAAEQEEISKLRAQVTQVDESIKKKEQENESLKNRIRKLAVA